jgi:hypothetical protein
MNKTHAFLLLLPLALFGASSIGCSEDYSNEPDAVMTDADMEKAAAAGGSNPEQPGGTP